MPLDSYVGVFLVGTAGGALLELLHWWNIRKRSDEFPKYARSPKYWIITAAMALVGGLLALIYFGDHVQAILALHIGLSAPLILQKLATTMAEPGERGVEETSVISFFTW
jgi:hypothetical protein